MGADIERPDHLRWLWDLDQGLDLGGPDWRKKQAQVQALPDYAYEPDPEVAAIIDEIAEGGEPELDEGETEALWEHLARDAVAFCTFFASFKNRDTRRRTVGQLTPAQKVLVWRVAYTVDAGQQVRLALLKQRRGGFSWVFTQLTYWLVGFRENFGAMQLAQDVGTATQLMGYLKDTYQRLPKSIRPAKKYSQRRLLNLAEPKQEEIDEGNYGLQSFITVESVGKEFVGTGDDVQVLHATEVGKWDKKCDTEVQWTSVTNTLPESPNTAVFAESTAHGARTFWKRFWDDAEIIGQPGWSGYTAVFIPWYFDPRNVAPCPPDVEWSTDSESEYGDEVAERRLYDLTDDQLWWRRIFINKQVSNVPGQTKLDKFRQEYPPTAKLAWVFAGGRFLSVQLVKLLEQAAKKKKKPIFVGELVTLREKGPRLTFEEITRPDRVGPLRIWRMPERGRMYVIGADISQGIVSGDHSCAKVYELGSMFQCAEWYGHQDPDVFADILWRLGHFYNVAVLNWERTGPGMGIAKFLRVGRDPLNRLEPYPSSRMYRRPSLGHVYYRPDQMYGMDTQGRNKRYLLANWLMAARDQLDVSEDDVLEASSLEVDDSEKVNTQGYDRFMASVMATNAAETARVIFDDEVETFDPDPPQGSVARSDVIFEQWKQAQAEGYYGELEETLGEHQ